MQSAFLTSALIAGLGLSACSEYTIDKKNPCMPYMQCAKKQTTDDGALFWHFFVCAKLQSKHAEVVVRCQKNGKGECDLLMACVKNQAAEIMSVDKDMVEGVYNDLGAADR